MKNTVKLMMVVLASLTLAACGQHITPSKTSYGQHGLVAILKGEASGAKKVSYAAGDMKGTVALHSGTYAITLPVTDKQQRVKLTAGDEQTTVTIKAAKTLGPYKTAAQKYNQAVVGMNLPAEIRKQATAAQKMDPKKIAALPPAERAAAMQQAQAVQKAMATAAEQTKSQQLPLDVKTGIHPLITVGDVRVRANVAASGELIGYALVVPVKTMKDKTKAKDFGMTLGLLGNSVGADTEHVMKQFTDATKGQSKSQTTVKSIKSHGVKFAIGFSPSDLFIYITR